VAVELAPIAAVEREFDQGIDGIVMGTRGRSGVDYLFTGSVAEKLVRSCPIPVLTVK